SRKSTPSSAIVPPSGSGLPLMTPDGRCSISVTAREDPYAHYGELPEVADYLDPITNPCGTEVPQDANNDGVLDGTTNRLKLKQQSASITIQLDASGNPIQNADGTYLSTEDLTGDGMAGDPVSPVTYVDVDSTVKDLIIGDQAYTDIGDWIWNPDQERFEIHLGAGTYCGGGQVREVLDILVWGWSFEGGLARPFSAS
ncbi:MAG: hypothetical protein ACE5Q3_19010, partial [Alphaproteobacteria bacterium]